MFVKKESVPPQNDPDASQAGAKPEVSKLRKKTDDMKKEELTKSEAGAPRGLKKRRNE